MAKHGSPSINKQTLHYSTQRLHSTAYLRVSLHQVILILRVQEGQGVHLGRTKSRMPTCSKTAAGAVATTTALSSVNNKKSTPRRLKKVFVFLSAAGLS